MNETNTLEINKNETKTLNFKYKDAILFYEFNKTLFNNNIGLYISSIHNAVLFNVVVNKSERLFEITNDMTIPLSINVVGIILCITNFRVLPENVSFTLKFSVVILSLKVNLINNKNIKFSKKKKEKENEILTETELISEIELKNENNPKSNLKAIDLQYFSEKFPDTFNFFENTHSKALNNIIQDFERKRVLIFDKLNNFDEKFYNLALKYEFSPYSIIDLQEQSGFEPSINVSVPKLIRIGNLSPTTEKENDLDIKIPALLPFSKANATSFLLNDNNNARIHNLLQTFALRLMLSIPINLTKFYFVDTFSFGANFSLVGRLDKKLITNGIITSQNDLTNLIFELEERLKEANLKYLHGFENLEEYNKKADKLAQHYKFVFISNFPFGFSENILTRFYNLLQQNPSRAGIFIFFSINKKNELPHYFDLNNLCKLTTYLYENSEIDYEIENGAFDKDFNDNFFINLQKELPSNVDEIIKFLNNLITNAKPNIVTLEEYFANLISKKQIWQESSANGLKIPIGFINPTTIQYFTFGHNTTDYFALIGGRPRYGKTVLLHNLIVNGSLLYSPFELNYYLIDCANGTGFRPYDKLPHVKILSISNDREFGASALDNIYNEMMSRAKTFKETAEKLNVTIEKIEDYRKITNNVIPRLFIIIDEFQALLETEDKITRRIRFLVDEITRQGAKFGIGLVLCTQNLGRVDIPTTNITLRIAFNLLEMDSLKVLGNDSATQLHQRGQAIFNNMNGSKNHNINFQGAYIENVIKYVDLLNSEFNEKFPNTTFEKYISDGKIVGRIEKNEILSKNLIENIFKINDRYCDIYVGEPAFIRKQHSFFRIRKQAGSNLLVVGNDLNSAISIISLSLFQLYKQSSDLSKFYIFDFFNIDSEFKGSFDNFRIFESFKVLPSRELTSVIEEIDNELTNRIEKEKNGENTEGRIILSLVYIQNSKDLKKDGYNVPPLTKKLFKLIKDGAEYGIHVFIYALNYKGITEILESTILNEFENKIALFEGESTRILTEQTASSVKQKNEALLQSSDEFVTYNPDLFRVYTEFNYNYNLLNPNLSFIKNFIK